MGRYQKVVRATKYRIYPSVKQESILSKHFGCVRWVWNNSLSVKAEAWATSKINLSRYQLSARLPVLKRDEKTVWLKEVNAQSLQSAVINLDASYTKFLRGKQGFPKFKSKHSKQSFQVPQGGEIGDGFVRIPKVGRIKAKISRVLEGNTKTFTVFKTTTGKYFVSVVVDDCTDPPEKAEVREDRTLGIDLGITHFATLSNGEKVENPKPLKKHLRKIKKAQRRLSKMKKGGKNRLRQSRVVARLHEKVANSRNDFLHKLTTRLVRDSQTDSFAIEDLAVKQMMEKGRLAQSIADASWSTFRKMLQYKAEMAGKNVLLIGRFDPSSKACSACGQVKKGLKLSDRAWTCQCGRTHDRDENAAQNIKRFALHPKTFTRAGHAQNHAWGDLAQA